jgi:hypothetical protein
VTVEIGSNFPKLPIDANTIAVSARAAIVWPDTMFPMRVIWSVMGISSTHSVLSIAVTLGCRASTQGAKFSSKMDCANAGVMEVESFVSQSLRVHWRDASDAGQIALKKPSFVKEMFTHLTVSKCERRAVDVKQFGLR